MERRLGRSAFLIGSQQTPTQDAEFAVDQLVQVAVRALSPGINDPFTAVTCIDRLSGCLCQLADRQLPSSLRRDQEGDVRVIANALTFADMADAAFRQIRQDGSSNYVALARLMDVIVEILAHAPRAGDREALKRHAWLTRQAAESLREEDERQAIERRWEIITQTERRQRLRHGPTAAGAC